MNSGRILALAVLAVLCGVCGSSLAQKDSVGRAIDATVETNRASSASQQRIDKLDDQTKDMLERFRSASWQAQQLTVYAGQLDELVSAQDAERNSIKRQIDEMERTERELLPLMLRMVEKLEGFIALDLPFLATERKERLDALKQVMADPEANNAEKFKRILETLQIEAEYGKTLGIERAQVGELTVDVLRMGRTAMYFLSADGDQAGMWNPASKQWQELPHRYVSEIRHGLRMARETAAPDLLELPVPLAGAGS